MPLGGTSVIHSAFQAMHAPVAEGGMTAVVDLYDPADAPTETYNRESGQTTQPVQVPAFARVPARIQSLSRGQGEDVADAAGQDGITPPYLVAIPYQLTADEDWIVIPRVSPDDPDLIDRRLTVRRVAMASQRFQRELYCDDE